MHWGQSGLDTGHRLSAVSSPPGHLQGSRGGTSEAVERLCRGAMLSCLPDTLPAPPRLPAPPMPPLLGRRKAAVHIQVMHPRLRVAVLSPPCCHPPIPGSCPAMTGKTKYHWPGYGESAEELAALDQWRWSLTPSGEAGGKGTGDGMEPAHEGAPRDSLGEETSDPTA